MKLTANAASVVRPVTKTNFSLPLTSDRLFLILEISGSEADTIGRQLLTQIHAAYLKNPPQSLAEFRQLINFPLNLDLSCSYLAVLLNQTQLIAIGTGGRVYLKRGPKTAILIDNNGAVSGQVKAGDKLLLVSKQACLSLGEKASVSALKSKDILTGTKILTTKLEAINSPPASGLLIFIREKSPVEFSVSLFKPINAFSRFQHAGRLLIRRFKTLPVNLNRRGWLMLGLILVLVASVGFGIKQQQMLKSDQQMELVLTDIQHKYEEGTALIDLNPVRSRELLQEARQLLEKTAPNLSKAEAEKVKSMQAKVDQSLTFAAHNYQVQLAPFFDLTLIKPKAEGKWMSLAQNVLGVLDTQNKTIYTVTVSSKSARITAYGESLSAAVSIAINGEEIFVLTEVEIQKVKFPEGRMESVIKKDDAWGKTSAIAFYNDSLYVADESRGRIWKYSNGQTGFSSRQDYLLYDTEVDLNGVTNLAIDGSVWLAKNSKILHFIQGKSQSWQIKGLDKPLGARLDLYTDDESKNLYILDKDQKRVVVSDKDGTYLSQYQWQDQIDITDMAVTESLKKILLLSNSIIYGIDLK